MAPIEKAKKVAKSAKKGKKHPVNSYLKGGILRYSKAQMYKRRALYRLKDKKSPVVEKAKVPIKKSKASYPTKTFVKKRPSKANFSEHKRNTRRNLTPGTVLILLAGRHQGKRVVLLKVLASGLLLVTGPFALNSCPLRRVSQRYVIGTSSKVDLGAFKVPEHLNDAYFRRLKAKKDKKTGEADIFAAKKERFVPNEQRKKDQKEVDAALLKVIKAHPEGKFFAKYLQNMFALHSSQYPHRMRF
uniref:Large ribosomal subunit protein eL6 n=2 Tax=Drosophila melanogaster TaxID=7227 RepID=Q9V9W2_DROME|nr:ribosomal protein L6, isoform A [Drosophila melanogaster]AAF57166.1 ribosomal protein L6, isoform A [Drosophila melanogaster]4V6W_CE Chain CE, 60S ribosomal protein L6, isoform A [Drosophila melanogaster]|eukprot:NP_733433.1 ribosomal protein L6, isoform A [Drosophila melanogaster]